MPNWAPPLLLKNRLGIIAKTAPSINSKGVMLARLARSASTNAGEVKVNAWPEGIG